VPTPAVSQLLYLLDKAFEGEDWHSFLTNLRAVESEDWEWIPPGGDRSIREIVQHVGGCKLMYDNHAFGDAALTWEHPLVDGVGVLATVPSAIEWLQQGHARLRNSLAELADDELLLPRMTNWGELKETRWIIASMIEHDLYHAGEINHIRSLRSRDDRWAYIKQQDPRPE
jgi:hypothetical protein